MYCRIWIQVDFTLRADAILIAYQMGKESKKKVLIRAPVASNIWSDNNCRC